MTHRFIRAGQLVPRLPSWVFDQRIPVGAVTLVVGRDGAGKSTFARWLAANASTGALTGTPLDVHLALLEDGAAEITQPGLLAAGADAERIELMLGEGWRFPRDLMEFEDHVRATDCRLVVIDPLAAVVSGLSGERAGLALRGLAGVAERTGIAIVLVHHTIKSARTADAAIAGSYNVKAAARSILFWDVLSPAHAFQARLVAAEAGAEVGEGAMLCLLRAHKTSYADAPPPLLFERRPAPHAADEHHSVAVVDLIAELLPIMAQPEEPDARERERAKRAILALLVSGPVAGRELEGLVMSITGTSRTSVQRARHELAAGHPPTIERYQENRQHFWRLVVPDTLA